MELFGKSDSGDYGIETGSIPVIGSNGKQNSELPSFCHRSIVTNIVLKLNN